MNHFTRRAIKLFSFLCIVTIIYKITKNHVPENEGTQNGKTDADVSFQDMDEVTLFNRISCYMYVPLEVDGKVMRRWLERPPGELKARGCQKSLPRVLMIGVKEGGTTAMGKYLGLHPSISYSYPVQPGPKINHETVEAWKGTFQLSSYKQLSFTGHQSLFSDSLPQLLQMVRKYLPDDVKLILMLRDPVQRLVSDYVHTLSIAERVAGDERKRYELDHVGLKGSLEATLLDETGHVNPFSPIVRNGMYNIEMRTLYQHIPKERILIIDGNAFRKDPYPSLVEMERFLNLPLFFKRRHFVYDEVKRVYCANVPSRPDVRCVTPLKGKTLPAIDDDLMLKLYKFFQPHNKELEEDFGVKFPWVYRPPGYIYLY